MTPRVQQHLREASVSLARSIRNNIVGDQILYGFAADRISTETKISFI